MWPLFHHETGHFPEKTATNFRFASSVAEFGLLLRNSPNKGKASFESILDRASGHWADIEKEHPADKE